METLKTFIFRADGTTRELLGAGFADTMVVELNGVAGTGTIGLQFEVGSAGEADLAG